MLSPAFYIILVLTLVILTVIVRFLDYKTKRAGQRVSAFCDTVEVDTSASLVDPVLTRDGYFIGDIVCTESGNLRRRTTVKNQFITTFLTDCPTFPQYHNELNWIRDWIRVKCFSINYSDLYTQILQDQIHTVPNTSLAIFYRDRMDPRKYLSPDTEPDIQTSRNIVQIDPLDDSWYFQVNAATDFMVFENVRSIVFRISRNHSQRSMAAFGNTTAPFIGTFCVHNTTMAVEVRAIKTTHRLFKSLQNFTEADLPPDEPRSCCICLEPINKTSPGISTLSCGHFDHDDCLNEWFDQSFSCPECRADDISIVQR